MSLEEYKLYSIPLYSLFIKDKLFEFLDQIYNLIDGIFLRKNLIFIHFK